MNRKLQTVFFCLSNKRLIINKMFVSNTNKVLKFFYVCILFLLKSMTKLNLFSQFKVISNNLNNIFFNLNFLQRVKYFRPRKTKQFSEIQGFKVKK